MNTMLRKNVWQKTVAMAAVCLATSAGGAWAQTTVTSPNPAPISITTLGTPIVENFDTLGNTSGSEFSTLPPGVQVSETGTSTTRVDGNYTADNGSSNAGDLYSYGVIGSTDRALGTLQSGSNLPLFGFVFRNNTGSTITGLNISYDGEQYRLGSTGRADRLDFGFRVGSTTQESITTGNFTDVDTLDFNSPVTTGTTGAITPATTSIADGFSTSIADGNFFYIRFSDFNAAGSDDGLAVDNFSVTAVPEPATTTLMLLGLAGTGMAARRRKKAQEEAAADETEATPVAC